MTEAATDTFELVLADKPFVFRKFDEQQLMMLRRFNQRQLDKIRQAPPDEQDELATALISEILDVIGDQLVDPQEIIEVERLMMRGKIVYTDVMKAVRNGRAVNDTSDDDDVAAAKPSKKAVAKRVSKAQKSTANPSRGRR